MPAGLADRAGFDDANRGLVGRLEPGMVKSADGRVVYDAGMFTQSTAGDPDTVHLSRDAPNSPAEGEAACWCVRETRPDAGLGRAPGL